MSTFLDAAYQILSENNRPMFPEEITKQALQREMIITQGATPSQSMMALLYMDIKKKGTASRFVQTGPSQFALNDQQTPKPVYQSQTRAPKFSSQSMKSKRDSVVDKSSPAHELLDQEIHSIQAFLNGQSEQPPTSEKICDWVTMCYCLGLYTEGAVLFSFVDMAEVNEWYYERTKKMARLCAMRSTHT